MGLMNRLVRMCKSDMHGIMDQMEDKSLVLKQCLREMEEEIQRKEAKLSELIKLHTKTKKDIESISARHGEVEKDLSIALENERDDIARFMIRKIKPLEKQRDMLTDLMATQRNDIQQYRDVLDQQRQHYETLKIKSMQYMNQQQTESWQECCNHLDLNGVDISDEEVEIELLRRKQTQKQGEKES
ncbi:MAG: PspA/IM30 family protein [Desulfobacterales bacterium]|nr:PspA/IM30 family protein [Desulfobacterales bacterium]